MKTTVKKVITHSGIFHADEIFSICILKEILPYIIIVRREPTKEELNDPTVIVLDVGGELDPDNWNFDHHQDINLPATCMMMLNLWNVYHTDMTSQDDITGDVYESIKKNLIEFISDMDTGRINGKYHHVPHVNKIIRGFNNVENGWDKAIQFAQLTWESIKTTAYTIAKEQSKWNHSIKLIGNKIVLFTGQYINGWRNIAAQHDIDYVCMQSNRTHGWNIITRDNDIILPTDEKATFYHQAGFMITFEFFVDVQNYINKHKL